MGEVHIRDYLSVSRQDMKQGKVSTTSMCGIQDPKMNTLTFGDPESVIKRKAKYICQDCRGRWVAEQEAVGDQARALHKFRKIMQKSNNFTRFNQPKSKIIKGR